MTFQNNDGYHTKVFERIRFATTHHVKKANICRHHSYWAINMPKHDKTFVDSTRIGQYMPKYDKHLYTLLLLGNQSQNLTTEHQNSFLKKFNLTRLWTSSL